MSVKKGVMLWQIKQWFNIGNRDILRSRKQLSRKISAAGMYEIVVQEWPTDPRVQADWPRGYRDSGQLPMGQIVHRDGIRKRNYVSRKYSLIIPRRSPTRKRDPCGISPHISGSLFIFRATERSMAVPATSSRIYHLQLRSMYDVQSSEETRATKSTNVVCHVFQFVSIHPCVFATVGKKTRNFNRDEWLIEVTRGFFARRDLILLLVLLYYITRHINRIGIRFILSRRIPCDRNRARLILSSYCITINTRLVECVLFLPSDTRENFYRRIFVGNLNGNSDRRKQHSTRATNRHKFE